MIRNQTRNCQLSLLLILLLLLALVGRIEMFYTRLRLLFSTVKYIFGLVSTKLSTSDKRLDQTLSEKYDIFPQVSHAFLNFKLWSWSILLFFFTSYLNRTAHRIIGYHNRNCIFLRHYRNRTATKKMRWLKGALNCFLEYLFRQTPLDHIWRAQLKPNTPNTVIGAHIWGVSDPYDQVIFDNSTFSFSARLLNFLSHDSD